MYAPQSGDPIVPPDAAEDQGEEVVILDPSTDNRRVKYVIANEGAGIVRERVQYYGADGKLITESLRDFTRKTVRQEFATLDAFLHRWSQVNQQQAIILELEERGVVLKALAELVGKEFDPFDLICHIAYDQPPLSRKERADQVRKRDYFTQYGEAARAVLEALLDKYANEGIENLADLNVLRVKPLKNLGTPTEIIQRFGGKQQYLTALREFQVQLYRVA